VDELHFFVYPLTLGSGDRQFPEGNAKTKFALAETEAYESGVVHVAYRPTQ
jgi:dihydrofolate reductase